MKKLCVIEGIYAIREDGQVAIFKLLGDDYWGCRADAIVQCAGDEPVEGINLQAGMRVWLDVETLIAEGIFFQHCVVDGIPANQNQNNN